MIIKQVKNIVDAITNKYQNGYLSGQEFNDYFRAAEIAHLSFLVGNLHQLQYGRPVPRVGLDMTKQITERLSPFRVTMTVSVPSNGEISKPTNIVSVEAFNKTDGTRVKFYPPQRASHCVNSVVWDLATDPIYSDFDTYWRVWPENITVVITYIKSLPHSKWAYTISGDKEQYDPINSVDPQWGDIDCVEIIGRMCKLIGVSLKDGELTQFAQSVIVQGE